jgi:hypothetical protein
VLGQRERARAGAGVQRGRQRQGICVEMTSKEFCSYAVVLATLERVGRAVSTRREEARQCTAPRRPRAHAGRATPGSRRHPFGSTSSVSRVGCMRPGGLHEASLSSSWRRHSGVVERRRRGRGEVTVRPTIVRQQREDGTGRHEAALAGCSHHDLAGITPAVGIGWSRGGDWGNGG